jgi:hypothetical protein
MKTAHCSTRCASGNILIVTLFVIGAMGIILVSMLTMTTSQNKMTARSQTWNSALAVAEAGAEEALAHLNKNGIGSLGITTNSLQSQGWTVQGANLFLQRQLGEDSYYEVTLKPGARPLITSTGYVPAPLQTAQRGAAFVAVANTPPWSSGKKFISRQVQVTVRAVGRFSKAIVAKDKVELNGKYVNVDSFHAYDPNASTWDGTNASGGSYDISKRRDHGDVAVLEGFHDDLNIKSASVWGKVSTGPDGDIKVDKKAVVGDVDWHNSGKTGVEPGWSANDANFDMPSVIKPFNSASKPLGGTVDGVTYDYILGNGDWDLTKLDGKVLVTGNARLLVRNDISFKDGPTDDEGIEFAPGGRLELYMDGKNAKLVGKKDPKKGPSLERTFNPGGNATNFFYFGTDKNLTLEMKNIDEFNGIVYAPKAQITLKAGSLKYYRCHLYGSIQGFGVKLEKNANVHYDENIGSLPADSFVVESWREL